MREGIDHIRKVDPGPITAIDRNGPEVVDALLRALGSRSIAG